METRVMLTDKEWETLTDRAVDPATGEERCTALPVCCAAVSKMRSRIIELRENQACITAQLKRDLMEAFTELTHYHPLNEWDAATLVKLMDQVAAAKSS